MCWKCNAKPDLDMKIGYTIGLSIFLFWPVVIINQLIFEKIFGVASFTGLLHSLVFWIPFWTWNISRKWSKE